MDITRISWLLLAVGLVIAAIGILIRLIGFISPLGRLPGDFYIEGENFTFYFPLTTSLLVSLVLSFIFLLLRFFR